MIYHKGVQEKRHDFRDGGHKEEMTEVVSYTSEVQFQKTYDVVVVGGGTTGACAAVAAARNGARTAIVEYYGFLGGNATCLQAWIGFHSYERRIPVVGGIPMEIVRRVGEVGGTTEFHLDPICSSVIRVNPTLLKMTLGRMMAENDVDVYFHSLAVGVHMEGNRVRSVIIQNKQGTQLLNCRVLIDCTDTGEIAIKAGAEFERGRRHDGKIQVSSYIHLLGDIDMDMVVSFFEANPTEMRAFPIPEVDLQDLIGRLRGTSLFVMSAFPRQVAEAKSSGVDYDRDRLVGVAFRTAGEMMLVSSRVQDVNMNDVKNFSRAELEGIGQTEGILRLLHGFIPGCSRARLVGSGHQIGVRESNHVIGDHYLTGEDLMNGRMFEDVIALGAYHIDIHTPDHSGLASFVQPPLYSIPYRSLLPAGVDGILVAGRAISASHEALASTRVIPISAAQGQAAGTAAALAVRDAVQPREVSVPILLEALQSQGAELGRGLA
jgi:hypothetical protein